MTEQIGGDAIREVAKMADRAHAVQEIEVGGIKRHDRVLQDNRKLQHEPSELEFTTLSSLAAFVTNGQDHDWVGRQKAFLVIADPTSVELCTEVFGVHAQRATIVRSTALVPTLRIAEWMGLEDFIVMLRGAMQPSTELDNLLRILGNVTSENVATVADDGVSQTVTARVGLVKVGNATIPSTITLGAWRSFREVGAVYCSFILRMRSGQPGSLPLASLHEADGGQWRLDARNAILDNLRAKLPETLINIYS